ncbi:hypothetical protein L7F22_014114 [Adiantum nelumboides]|nr:hypothetical protein [Adiantum nelumboides]
MKGKERLFPKLGMRYYGPFQICDKISDVAYRLKLPEGWKIHNAFHVSLLRPFVGDVPEDMVPEEQPEVEELDEILVPEQILAHKDRKVRGKVARRYLVKFKNYSPMDAKWMEEAELFVSVIRSPFLGILLTIEIDGNVCICNFSSLPAQGFMVAKESLSDSMVGITMNAGDMDMSPPLAQNRELAPSLSSSEAGNHPGNFAVENSPVMQAFQLLQTNPKVQEVVKSLARDPAVWNAMLSNEKVLELAQENSHDTQDAFGYDDDDDDDDEDEFLEMMELGTKFASKFYGLVTRTKVYYGYVRRKLFSILDSMFGSMEKTLLTKQGASAKDKTVTSCMMLAVAVVVVVVVQRSLKRS